jgi:hypothetical protein
LLASMSIASMRARSPPAAPAVMGSMREGLMHVAGHCLRHENTQIYSQNSVSLPV